MSKKLHLILGDLTILFPCFLIYLMESWLWRRQCQSISHNSFLLVTLQSLFLGHKKSQYRYWCRAFLLVMLQIDSKRQIKKYLEFEMQSQKLVLPHLLISTRHCCPQENRFHAKKCKLHFPNFFILPSHSPLTLASVSFVYIQNCFSLVFHYTHSTI